MLLRNNSSTVDDVAVTDSTLLPSTTSKIPLNSSPSRNDDVANIDASIPIACQLDFHNKSTTSLSSSSTSSTSSSNQLFPINFVDFALENHFPLQSSCCSSTKNFLPHQHCSPTPQTASTIANNLTQSINVDMMLEKNFNLCSPTSATISPIAKNLTQSNNIEHMLEKNFNSCSPTSIDELKSFPIIQKLTKNFVDHNKFPLTMHQYQKNYVKSKPKQFFFNDLKLPSAAVVETMAAVDATITHTMNLATLPTLLHGKENVYKLEERQHQQEAQVHCDKQNDEAETQTSSSTKTTTAKRSPKKSRNTSKNDEAADDVDDNTDDDDNYDDDDDGIATEILKYSISKLENFKQKNERALYTHNIIDDDREAVDEGEQQKIVAINENAPSKNSMPPPPLIYDDNATQRAFENFNNCVGDDFDVGERLVDAIKQEQTLLATKNYYSDVRDTSAKQVLAVIAATTKDKPQQHQNLPAGLNEFSETSTAATALQHSKKSNLKFLHAIVASTTSLTNTTNITTTNALHHPSVYDNLPNFELLPNYLVASNERNCTAKISAAIIEDSSNDKLKNNSNINASSTTKTTSQQQHQSIIEAADVKNCSDQIFEWFVISKSNRRPHHLRRAFSEMTLAHLEDASTAVDSSTVIHHSNSEPASPTLDEEQSELDEMKFEMPRDGTKRLQPATLTTTTTLKSPTLTLTPTAAVGNKHERTALDRERRLSSTPSATNLLRLSQPHTKHQQTRTNVATVNSNKLQQRPTDSRWSAGSGSVSVSGLTATSTPSTSSLSSNYKTQSNKLQQRPTDWSAGSGSGLTTTSTPSTSSLSANYKPQSTLNEHGTRRREHNDAIQRSATLDTLGRTLPPLASSASLTTATPRSSLLRRQRRMASQDSLDKEEDPIVRLNRLRARISGALSEVKGVLNKYSTETEPETQQLGLETLKSSTTIPLIAKKPWEAETPTTKKTLADETQKPAGEFISVESTASTAELQEKALDEAKESKVAAESEAVTAPQGSSSKKLEPEPSEANHESSQASITATDQAQINTDSPNRTSTTTTISTTPADADAGPVKFRFVRKTRRRSVFLEDGEVDKKDKAVIKTETIMEAEIAAEESLAQAPSAKSEGLSAVEPIKPTDASSIQTQERRQINVKRERESEESVAKQESAQTQAKRVGDTKELPKIEIRQASQEVFETTEANLLKESMKSKLKIKQKESNRRASTGAIRERLNEDDDDDESELKLSNKNQRRISDTAANLIAKDKVQIKLNAKAEKLIKTQKSVEKEPLEIELEVAEKKVHKKRVVLKRGVGDSSTTTQRRASIAAVEKSKIDETSTTKTMALKVKAQRRPSDVTATATTMTANSSTKKIEPQPAVAAPPTTAKTKLIMRRPTPRVRAGAKIQQSNQKVAPSKSSASSSITTQESFESTDETTSTVSPSSTPTSGFMSSTPTLIDNVSAMKSNSIYCETINENSQTMPTPISDMFLDSTSVPANLVQINVSATTDQQQKAQIIETTKFLAPTATSASSTDTNNNKIDNKNELINHISATHAKSLTNNIIIDDINKPIHLQQQQQHHQRESTSKIPPSIALNQQQQVQQQHLQQQEPPKVAINVDIVEHDIKTKAANVEVKNCSATAIASSQSQSTSISLAAKSTQTPFTNEQQKQQEQQAESEKIIEMPELQISPAPVKAVQIPVADKRKFAPLNLPREDLPKPKIIFKKVVKQKSTEKQQHQQSSNNKKSIGTSITLTTDEAAAAAASPITTSPKANKRLSTQKQSSKDVETQTETILLNSSILEPAAADVAEEPASTAPTPALVKQPRKIKKKVIIKRQQRRLSVSDQTFFNSETSSNSEQQNQAENEPAQPEYETLERAIAYVTDDEDDENAVDDSVVDVAAPLKGCMRQREFEIGDLVMYAERYKRTQVRWKKGRVLERITSISYKLDIDGKEVPAHISYIKRYTDRKVSFGGKEYLEIEYEQLQEDLEKKQRRSYSIWNMV